MSVNPLLSLPTILLCDVLGTRLTLKEIVRLDSAFCHRQSRDSLVSLFQAKQFSLHTTVDISNVLALNWLLRNGVKVHDIELSLPTEVQSVIELLRHRGDAVRAVHFNGTTMAPEMSLVALYCKNLKKVRFAGTVLTNAFNDILWCNPNIQEIRCESVTISQSGLFAGLKLNSLKLLRVEHTNECMNGFPWSSTASSQSLHQIILRSCSIHTSDLVVWTKQCPELKSICTSNMAVTDRSMVEMALSATHLCKLSIFMSKISDGGVLSILTHLQSLRSLRLQSCTLLTDLAILHIANQCGATVTELYIDVKSPTSTKTEQYLLQLSQKCVVLKTLCIDCGEQVLCSGGGTCIIAVHCTSLRRLIANKQTAICESTRRLVAIVRPDLELAVLDPTNAYDVMSMPV